LKYELSCQGAGARAHTHTHSQKHWKLFYKHKFSYTTHFAAYTI